MYKNDYDFEHRQEAVYTLLEGSYKVPVRFTLFPSILMRKQANLGCTTDRLRKSLQLNSAPHATIKIFCGPRYDCCPPHVPNP